jgi:hypothetical protein
MVTGRRRSRMNRAATGVLTGAVAIALLAGCGGDDAYCAAVKENRSALDGFGTKDTQADFTTETKAVQNIATTAPDGIKDDWAAVGAAMERVTKAQKAADITLEDMADADALGEVGEKDLAAINKAYDVFNKTTKQRAAVVKDVRTTCEITLK